MKALTFVVVVVSLAGCKNKNIPFKPPPDAAAHQLADASPDIDAAVAATVRTAKKVVVGDHTTCAIMTDATLRCWGSNSDGQLGNGTTTDSATPVMPNLRGVTDVVLGTAHACALLDDRSVTCWGRINFGHKDNLLQPAAAPGVAKVKRVFAVGSASCATLDDGPLVCWGDVDLQGHLRAPGGGSIDHRVPTPAEHLDHVTMLTANGALHENGTVSTWTTDGVPKLSGLADVTEIATSGERLCGLRKDGSVACVGTTPVCAAAVPKPAPVKATPAPKTKAKTSQATTEKSTAKAKTTAKATAKAKPTAKTTAKTKTTTGATATAKTSAKAKTDAKAKTAAAPVAKPVPPPPSAPVEVLRLPPAKHLAFDVGLCVITKTGALQCVSGCTADSPWSGLTNVESVSGSCARLHGGAVKCWDADRKTRVVSAIAGVAAVRDMSVSASHACALLNDQQIVCWGSNKSGALGRGEIDDDLHREARAVAF